jgi:hypothetical protein
VLPDSIMLESTQQNMMSLSFDGKNLVVNDASDSLPLAMEQLNLKKVIQ